MLSRSHYTQSSSTTTCKKSQLSKDDSIKPQYLTSGDIIVSNNNMESPSANDAIKAGSTEFVLSISTNCLQEHMRKLLKKLELTEFYPKKLTVNDIMQLKSSEAEHRLAWKVVNSILMRDLEGRDSEVHMFNTSTGKSEINIAGGLGSLLSSTKTQPDANLDLNALDVFVAIFHCCDLMLRQVLCEKLFLCQLAYPIMIPNPDNCQIEQCLWSLRTIKIERSQSTGKPGIVTLPAAHSRVVSFIRFGNISLPKSTVLNEILGIPNAFFNRNCKTGHTKKYLSNGLVECCMFQPAGVKCDLFKDLTLLLNLRGDAKTMANQLILINKLSDVVVVMLDPEGLEDAVAIDRIQSLQDTHVIFILLNQNITDEQLAGFIAKFQEQVGKEFAESISPILYTQHGLQKNVQKLTSELCQVIEKLSPDIAITLDERVKTMKDTPQVKNAKLTIDEYYPDCEEGHQLANKYMKEIRALPIHSSKHDLLPLQGEEWKHWSRLLRKYEGSKMNIHEKDAIKQEMNKISSRRASIHPSKMILDMADKLNKFINTKKVEYFIQWMRIALDEKSMDDLSSLRHEWNKARLIYETAKKGNEKNLAELLANVTAKEKIYMDASLGLEHFLRELGHIYDIFHNTNMYQDVVEHLPRTMAHLLLHGVPFELMDGDAGNIPCQWVTAVFDNLKNIVGDKKVYVLSVLGIQSSGKSTLLNTMFGLNFAVSAGRCTRGLYLHILHVDKKSELPFDYLLVVDTEGLRSQETGNEQMHIYDNMLATLVIGIADLTIVNIKGENPSEMKDILEIAVHAFLKIRLSNCRMNVAQRCMFVHQNVSAVDASGNLLLSQTKFIDDLNEITKSAAEKESMENVELFSDVIQFYDKTDYDRWYFSDCWRGDPPMAPANPGYSRKIVQAKHCILDEIALHEKNVFKMSELVLSLNDLWQGVLSLDFVFSFRNSLEIKASSLLDETYCCILAEMEQEMSRWVLTKTNHVKSAANDKTLDDLKRTLPTELQKEGARCQCICATKLMAFFDTNKFMHITDQWQHRMTRDLQRSCAALITEGLDKFKEEDERQRVEIFRKSAINIHKEKLIKRAMDAAKQCTGQNLSEEDLKMKFSILWSELIEGLPQHSTRLIDVPVVFQDELYTFFNADRHLISRELGHTSLDSPWSGMPLSRCMTLEMIQSTHTRVRNKGILKPNTWFKSGNSETYTTIVLQETINILSVAENYINTLCERDIDFQKQFALNVIQLVSDKIEQTNNLDRSAFPLQLQSPYKVMAMVKVCHYAAQKYKELHDRFESKHGMKTTIERCRRETWNLFRNTAKEAEEEKIAADLFCDKLKPAITDSIQGKVEEKLKNDCVMSFSRNKFHFMTKLLESLAHKNTFLDYTLYVKNPQLFACDWMYDYFNEEIMQKHKQYVDDSAQSLIRDILKKIETSCKSCNNTQAMMESFCLSVKDDIAISQEELEEVSQRHITRVDNFLSNIAERLDDINLFLGLNQCDLSIGQTSSIIWQGEAPHKMALKTLWGCTEVCPYCHEPCSNPKSQHWNNEGDQCHITIQHKPRGIIGGLWHKKHTLVVESCNYAITTKRLQANSSGDEPYREYKKYYPSWDIAPSQSVDSCKYWMRFMYQFKEHLERYYDAKDTALPISWGDITQDQALESLRKFTGETV